MAGGAALIGSASVAAAVLIAAVATARSRRLVIALLSAVPGAAVGLATAWITTVPLDLFDVQLSPVSTAWIGAAFAAAGVAVAAIIQGGTRRRVLGAVALVLALLSGALGVNADFGQYTTLGSFVDQPIALPLARQLATAQAANAPGTAPLTAAAASAPAAELWRDTPIPSAPHDGVVAQVTIPATVSHFPARPAYVYLPPAAQVPDPPRLPVLIFLSGQPGAPQNVIQSGRMADIMNAFAHAHGGLAPIVVAPDQLGSPASNPMCVDSPLGDSATYLTVDVPNWIRTHLAVQPQRSAWAIGGFSQGGTCSIQLGAGFPKLFGSIIDVSGQVHPINGSVAQTIARGFGGDAAKYRAAQPLSLLAAHAPYSHVVGVFGSGALDAKYTPEANTVAAAARAAGIRTSRVVSPGTAHDWHTVQWVLGRPSTPVWRHLGIEKP
ncbi:alpha/beta hydrolase [Pseudolysinimonas sp.]|uniref:alpha/beta hydrolase n=1 Tax=Pseudolysinimonas sp. TaxID=2680009 RepID=UPI003F81592F